MLKLFEGVREVAARKGWKLDPAEPGVLNLYSVVTLTGMESGVPVRLERVGGAQMFTTQAFLQPPLPFHFAITHQGLAASIANLVGFHDIEVGDAAFDKSFRVVSRDKAAIVGLLTPPVREILTRLSEKTHPLGLQGFHVSEQGVSLSRVTQPFPMTADELLADVPISVQVVQALRAQAG